MKKLSQKSQVTQSELFEYKCQELEDCKKAHQDCMMKLERQIKITSRYRLALLREFED